MSNPLIRTFLVCLVALTAVSFAQNFELTDQYNSALSFEVTDFARSVDGNSSFEYRVNDLTHDQLLAWLEENNQGWNQHMTRMLR
jgi:hypothetical protein